MEHYSFNILNRVWAIFKLFSKPFKCNRNICYKPIIFDKNKFLLLESTKLVNILKIEIKSKKQKYVSKKINRKESLNLGTLKNRVLQEMILICLDPFYDVHLDCNTYGWRKRRPRKYAVSQLWQYLYQGQHRKKVISLSLKGFFGQIYNTFFQSLKVPSKFRLLIDT